MPPREGGGEEGGGGEGEYDKLQLLQVGHPHHRRHLRGHLPRPLHLSCHLLRKLRKY